MRDSQRNTEALEALRDRALGLARPCFDWLNVDGDERPGWRIYRDDTVITVVEVHGVAVLRWSIADEGLGLVGTSSDPVDVYARWFPASAPS